MFYLVDFFVYFVNSGILESGPPCPNKILVHVYAVFISLKDVSALSKLTFYFSFIPLLAEIDNGCIIQTFHTART